MEFKEDEILPKRRNSTEIQSICSEDSVFSMPNLPEELITEIMLRLPVKSLLQFRSVSKSWLSLISTSYFVKTHLLLSASNKDYIHHEVITKASNTSRGVKNCSVSSLLYDSVPESFELDNPGKNPNAFPLFVGSVNGLICLAINIFYGLDCFIIWNPSIRKYKKLPYEEHIVPYFTFGFAYDEFEDDYKIVGIFPIYSYASLCRVEVKIYSLKSDSWKRVKDYKGVELLGDFAKFVNGKLHWLDKHWNIISMDLADEKWAEVDQPCCFKGCGFLKLGVFESDLSVFCNHAWTHVDVWVMKEYGVKESWTKMFTIKSPEDSMGRIFYPIILMSNEGEILLKFGSRFTKYNPKDDSVRYLDVTKLAPCHEVQIYVKSLVCPLY
ncbi:hypothetical protein H5410_048449 [Solanum commersonii]|uniref:F-box domain-containing protein n=1 Tax=Solanum commersonii TaxID=4109 RepID=A0A9J5XKF9_SOLCO|nr:hypothetical protein H5410_048449 [Solanum commersonii]